MQSYFPGMKAEPNADFRIVINLDEVLGTFNYDLSDPKFEHIAEQFAGDTGGYICRGLIHSVMRIPGGLSVDEAVRFFPYHLMSEGRFFLEQFWASLSSEICRQEQIIRHAHPNRSFQANTQPSPMVNGYSTLTIWYHWLTPEMIALDNSMELDYDGVDEPAPKAELLGF